MEINYGMKTINKKQTTIKVNMRFPNFILGLLDLYYYYEEGNEDNCINNKLFENNNEKSVPYASIYYPRMENIFQEKLYFCLKYFLTNNYDRSNIFYVNKNIEKIIRIINMYNITNPDEYLYQIFESIRECNPLFIGIQKNDFIHIATNLGLIREKNSLIKDNVKGGKRKSRKTRKIIKKTYNKTHRKS
jgi:hypothetical protein